MSLSRRRIPASCGCGAPSGGRSWKFTARGASGAPRSAFVALEQRLLNRNRHGRDSIAQLFELQADASWSLRAEHVIGIEQGACAQAQAAAADAVGEVVAQPLQMHDPIVEVGAPTGGQPRPVATVRYTAGRQRGERVTDAGQR